MMIRNLEQAVFAYIEAQGMITAGDEIYAAVSGGADSVCLLLLLAAYRRRCSFALKAVHVEHGIRGEESREDARFVERLCKDFDVPVEVAHEDVPAFAREKGLSLEEAARIRRYDIFEKLGQNDSGGSKDFRVRVALAHHMEDQAETVLFNLARGTGLLGMGGMRPVRGRYIRPLLECRREGIEACLREQGIAWREDRTNSDQRYARNLIRHSILPVLAEGVNAQAVAHICEAASYARDAADHLEREAERFCEAYMRVDCVEAPAEAKYAASADVLIETPNAASIKSANVRGKGAGKQDLVSGEMPDETSREALREKSGEISGETLREASGETSGETLREASPETIKQTRVILQVDPLRSQEKILREQVLRRAVRLARGGRGLKDVGAVHIADLDALIFKPRGKHLDLPGFLKAERVDRTIVLFCVQPSEHSEVYEVSDQDLQCNMPQNEPEK